MKADKMQDQKNIKLDNKLDGKRGRKQNINSNMTTDKNMHSKVNRKAEETDRKPECGTERMT